jgi:hypothetical protein
VIKIEHSASISSNATRKLFFITQHNSNVFISSTLKVQARLAPTKQFESKT